MTKKLILSILVLMFIGSAAFSHPPKEVELKFDKEASVLKITIIHPVKNAKVHFIETIVVFVDGKEYKVIKCKDQKTNKEHTYKLEMPDIKEGSVIKVKAVCNKGGSKKAKIVV